MGLPDHEDMENEETEPTQAVLEAWAKTKPREALAGLAHSMVNVYLANKAQIIRWVLANEVDLLRQSYLIEQRGLAYAAYMRENRIPTP